MEKVLITKKMDLRLEALNVLKTRFGLQLVKRCEPIVFAKTKHGMQQIFINKIRPVTTQYISLMTQFRIKVVYQRTCQCQARRKFLTRYHCKLMHAMNYLYFNIFVLLFPLIVTVTNIKSLTTALQWTNT
jgi:hypothetical protein